MKTWLGMFIEEFFPQKWFGRRQSRISINIQFKQFVKKQVKNIIILKYYLRWTEELWNHRGRLFETERSSLCIYSRINHRKIYQCYWRKGSILRKNDNDTKQFLIICLFAPVPQYVHIMHTYFSRSLDVHNVDSTYKFMRIFFLAIKTVISWWSKFSKLLLKT